MGMHDWAASVRSLYRALCTVPGDQHDLAAYCAMCQLHGAHLLPSRVLTRVTRRAAPGRTRAAPFSTSTTERMYEQKERRASRAGCRGNSKSYRALEHALPDAPYQLTLSAATPLHGALTITGCGLEGTSGERSSRHHRRPYQACWRAGQTRRPHLTRPRTPARLRVVGLTRRGARVQPRGSPPYQWGARRPGCLGPCTSRTGVGAPRGAHVPSWGYR